MHYRIRANRTFPKINKSCWLTRIREDYNPMPTSCISYLAPPKYSIHRNTLNNYCCTDKQSALISIKQSTTSVLTWSCGNSSVVFPLNRNGTGINRNKAIKNMQPVTTPIASGLKRRQQSHDKCTLDWPNRNFTYTFGLVFLHISCPNKFAFINMSLNEGIRFFVIAKAHTDMPKLMINGIFIVTKNWFS